MPQTDVGSWSAILTIIVFFLTNIVAIFPFRVPIPKLLVTSGHAALVKTRVLSPTSEPLRRTYIHFTLNTVPLFSVLLLLAVGAIGGNEIRRGIVGADGVKPIDIMALFISLAYLSISLDAAGLFRFLAFWAARKGGSSGPKLYFYLYSFFLICGVIVGNDPVILSGTAFLAYFTRVSGIVPPTAWIFAQFSAANMASAVLVSSNPTNLVLSGAFSLSFITYASRLVLPVIVSAIAVYPILTLVLFRSTELIPSSIDLSDDDDKGSSVGSAALVDKHGAIFGSILVLITLGVLVGTSTIHVPVYMVTVPPAVIMFLRDGLHDWMHRKQNNLPSGNGSATPSSPIRDNAYELQPIPSELPSPQPGPSRSSSPTPKRRSLIGMLTHVAHRIGSAFPTVSAIVRRLPIPLVPFAFLMFILVQGLGSKGWVEVFATWWSAWIDKTSVLGAVGGMMFISCILCNLCGTNIGATILLARVLQVHFDSRGSEDMSPQYARERLGAIYALALGSNYGAFTLSFSASLAGLLWRDILRQKGIHVRKTQFLRLNFVISAVAALAGCGMLVGELYAW